MPIRADLPESPTQNLVRRAESAVAWISRAAMWLAALSCLSTLALVCYAVAMRYFLNRPQSWTDELAGWMIVITVMLAMPEAQRRGEHIGVDAITTKARGRARRWLAMLSVASVIATGWLILRGGLEMVFFTRMMGMLSIALPDLDLWIVQALVPLGGLLLILVAGGQLLCWASGIEPRDFESSPTDSHE